MNLLRGCTCSARYLRSYSTTSINQPQDKLILAAKKLVAEAQKEEGSSIEQAKRLREVEGLRKALIDVEEGEEVSKHFFSFLYFSFFFS